MDNHKNIRKIIKDELFKLNESRLITFTGDIMYSIGKNVPDLKRIASNSMVDGSEGIFRYKDGNAYEIQIRPIEYANDKDNWAKYTAGKSKVEIPKQESGNKVTTEDVKQALWLAFKETVDKIDFVGEDTDSYKYKITYNETFDTKNIENNLKGLERAGLGVFTLSDLGNGVVRISHKKGTGEKIVYDELFKQQS